MEENKINIYDFDFDSLFISPDKIYKINFQTRIIEVEGEGEQLSLDISSKINKNLCYKGFNIIKGEIFPTPKKNDVIEISQIEYKLDDDLNLGIFIKASHLNSNNINLISDKNITTIINFAHDKLINTLKKLMKIKEDLKSNIFIVEKYDANNSKYILRCIENNCIYTLKQLDDSKYKINNIVYVLNFCVDEDEIKLTKISLLFKLTQENLFFLLEKRNILKGTYFFGKVVEINQINIYSIILSDFKQLFILPLTEIKISDLGQLIFISKYIIHQEKNLSLPILRIDKDSFIFLSEQNLYFSNKIEINNISIIQFHFLDFIMKNDKKDTDNLYNAIEINDMKIKINKDEMNIIIEKKRIKNYDYYPIIIKLIHIQNKLKNKTFNFNLMHGFINKINAFINNIFDKSYFYEYLYYSFGNALLKSNKKIKIQDKDILIFNFDKFESTNRLRFNVLNVPFQKECKENILNNYNSLLICEIFKDIYSNKSEIVGVFSIDKINEFIPTLKSNNIFDTYYDDFGFIYNYLIDIKSLNLEEFINKCKKNYEELIKTNSSLDFMNIGAYEEDITFSQLKTRIGILCSHYLSQLNKNTIVNKLKGLLNIFSTIYDYKEYLSYNQFLRIYKFLIRTKFDKMKDFTLYFTAELNEFSPYLVAYEFMIEEIKNITESSRLFMGYLELDSYILNNFINDNKKSYSLSILPLFVVKNHLLQNYEGFFLTDAEPKDEVFARSMIDERITILNVENIFKYSPLNLNQIDEIKSPITLKNHAFSISMEFRHENNGHYKKNKKDKRTSSPIYYFDKEKIKKIEYAKNGVKQGEDGSLIEALIDENRDAILSLQNDIFYGSLLDVNLFIKSDFKQLKQKIAEIKNDPTNFKDASEQLKNENNKINSNKKN
mgnify:CR=1 FL=1